MQPDSHGAHLKGWKRSAIGAAEEVRQPRLSAAAVEAVVEGWLCKIGIRAGFSASCTAIGDGVSAESESASTATHVLCHSERFDTLPYRANALLAKKEVAVSMDDQSAIRCDRPQRPATSKHCNDDEPSHAICFAEQYCRRAAAIRSPGISRSQPDNRHRRRFDGVEISGAGRD